MGASTSFERARVADAAASDPRERPPVLLSNGDWFGTLAAVRDLGRRGVPVHVARAAPFEVSSWSRYARKRLRSPPVGSAAKHLRWLLETGRRDPGSVLCATSDDLCFLYAAHEQDLRQCFRLATPGLAALRELLDKERLSKNASGVGLRTPASLFPTDAADAVALAAAARWPQLIKQRTQVFSRTLHKGTPVRAAGDLPGAYERFRRLNPFESIVLQSWPDADRPLLQDYLPQSARRIYSLSGFVSPGCQRWAMRAALKVLSHPRYLGVGLLFEEARVLPHLEERIIRLCRSVGYAGVFECEFIEHDREHLLIDFNPRFYNFMAFDQERGLPQAWLSYLLALGAHNELERELERAAAHVSGKARTVYFYRLGAFIQLRLERLFRRIPREEAAHWRLWRSAAAEVDPVWASDDPRPAVADVLQRCWRLARHPRAWLRSNARRPF